MVHRSFVRWAACAALSLVVPVWAHARDDFEKDLLQKFQKQNQKDAIQVKADVEKLLAEALAVSPLQPEKALMLLWQCRELLDMAGKLPRAEREALARQVDDGFRDARARVESKQEAARAAEPKPSQGQVISPGVAFVPNIVQVPVNLTLGPITPVVSADRRWVRIGISGRFTFLSGVRPTPVQVPVQGFVQGPAGTSIPVPGRP
jgi:hypothetical protein